MTLRTGFLWTLIGSLMLAAALGVAALMLPALFPQTSRILATALVISGASLICLACAVVLERRRIVPVGWIGIVTAVAAAGIWLMSIWGLWSSSHYAVEELLERIGGTLQTVAVWAGIVAVLSIRTITASRFRWPVLSLRALVSVLAAFTIVGIWADIDEWWWLRGYAAGFTLIGWSAWLMLLMTVQCRRRPSRIVAGATAAVGTILAAVILLLVWEITDDSDWMIRILSALIILTACGTLVAPILALLDRQAHRASMKSVASRVRIDLTCPRCGVPQTLHAAHDKCRNCGLRIDIAIEEPRCACGYLIYKLESDRCPECGRAIPVEERWADPETGPAGSSTSAGPAESTRTG